MLFGLAIVAVMSTGPRQGAIPSRTHDSSAKSVAPITVARRPAAAILTASAATKEMASGTFFVSLAALTISVLSFSFGLISWRETYRPIVTARVATYAQGNQGIFLNLLVENTGSRPACNVQLLVDETTLTAALDPSLDVKGQEEIRGCFSPKFTIPVLANGASTSNAFGMLAWPGTLNVKLNAWVWHSRMPVEVRYLDLRGRKFSHRLDLFVADSSGFASTSYADRDG